MLTSWNHCCSRLSQRWVFTILASTGLCLGVLYQSFLSITILEMVGKSESSEVQDSGNCPRSRSDSLKNKTYFFHDDEDDPTVPRYQWDEYTQGIILSSIAWSYTLGRFSYDPLAKCIGGKYVLGLGIFMQAALTFITPFTLNSGGSTALIVNRVLIGVGNSGMFPAASKLIAHWSTLTDRNIIGMIVYNGPVLGVFFGNIVPPLVIKYFGMGWPGVFYFVGILGMIWLPFWLLLVYESPEVHPFITERELQLLKETSEAENVKSKLPPIPWKHILSCKEFWAFTIVYSGSNWALYVILTGLPRYMANVVNLPLEDNGYVSSLPFIFMWLNCMASAWMNEKILEKQWLSLTNSRKLLTTLSTTGPALFLLLASYAGCDKTIVVAMFLVGITLNGCFLASTMLNPLDLSPNYAGSLMCLGEGIASSIGIIAPYIIGVLAPDSTLAQWRILFWIVFAFAVLPNAVYLTCFKAELQPWNDPEFLVKSKANEIMEMRKGECKLEAIS